MLVTDSNNVISSTGDINGYIDTNNIEIDKLKADSDNIYKIIL